jgi:hypothetical protein
MLLEKALGQAVKEQSSSFYFKIRDSRKSQQEPSTWPKADMRASGEAHGGWRKGRRHPCKGNNVMVMYVIGDKHGSILSIQRAANTTQATTPTGRPQTLDSPCS